jgi:hypothetical protein
MKNLIEKIKIFFTFFFNNFLYEYSEEWDKTLNELLKTEEPILGEPNTIDNQYYIMWLGNVQIWIQNYPYGFGKKYVFGSKNVDVRPSKITIHKLKKIVDELKRKKRFKRKINVNKFKLLKNNY